MSTLTERPRWQRARHEDSHLVQVTDAVYLLKAVQEGDHA